MPFSDFIRRKPLDAVLADTGDDGGKPTLRRALGAGNLILLGIGGIIGAGIFATVGTAAVGDAARPGAGPALVLSFVFTAVACGFAALCYAEFASMVPISGSAYTYAYTTLGELVAWIIGWDLIIEYAVGNVAVAISWSGYFDHLLRGLGIHLPAWSTIDFRTAIQGESVWKLAGYLQGGGTLDGARTAGFGAKVLDRAATVLGETPGQDISQVAQVLQAGVIHAHSAMTTAPHLFGLPLVFNVPAAAVVMAITAVLVVGIRESAAFNAVMVAIKLAVLGLFVAVGAHYIDPGNYSPFAPNGWAGIQAGAAIVFFAYIGFDAVSTVAEETRNPSRNLPIGIIGSLVICTVIYIVVAAVLTGMVPLSVFTQENKAEPLTVALDYHNLGWITGVVAFGSVVAHTCVLLVFQLGQPRIFFSMSRDGLLPPSFANVHPRFRTPWITTIVTGVLVAVTAGLTNIDEMVDLTNIGTLFAFILVCLGIVILRRIEPDRRRPFRVPFSPVFPLLGVATCAYLATGLPVVTWIRFGVWLLVGLCIYLGYGRRRSRLIHRLQG
jgi:basic amino acid/polyamine antiporter, APA family